MALAIFVVLTFIGQAVTDTCTTLPADGNFFIQAQTDVVGEVRENNASVNVHEHNGSVVVENLTQNRAKTIRRTSIVAPIMHDLVDASGEQHVHKARQCMAKAVDVTLDGALSDWEHRDKGFITTRSVLVASTVASVLVLFAGHRLFHVVVVLTSGGAGFLAAFKAMMMFMAWCSLDSAPFWAVYLRTTPCQCIGPLVVGIGASLAAAYVAHMLVHLTFAILGAAVGVVVAFLGRQASILLWLDASTAERVFTPNNFLIMVVCIALLGAFIAHRFQHDVLALVTAILGAFGFSRSLKSSLSQGGMYQMSDETMLYVVAVSFGLGFAVQLVDAHKHRR